MGTSNDVELAMGTGGVTAGELVAAGATLMRIENDSMLAVAVQRPRKEAEVVKGALAELDIVPEEAKAAYYSIPYRERQPDGSTKLVKVEGPSIKAAMALARRWGNCTVSARFVNEDAENVDVEGVFIDLETNFRVSRPFRVMKIAHRRGNRVEALNPQRLVQTLQAGASKAVRNAIVAGLPAYLVNAYDKHAREIVGGKLDEPAKKETIDACLRAFEKLKVTPEMLERYVGLPPAKWTGAEVADLRGLHTGIIDGQISAEDAFATREEHVERRVADITAEKTDELREQVKQANAKAEEKDPPPPITGTDCGCPDAPNDEHLAGCAKAAKATPPKTEPAASSPKAKGRLF